MSRPLLDGWAIGVVVLDFAVPLVDGLATGGRLAAPQEQVLPVLRVAGVSQFVRPSDLVDAIPRVLLDLLTVPKVCTRVTLTVVVVRRQTVVPRLLWRDRESTGDKK